jgi:hypothetical protein
VYKKDTTTSILTGALIVTDIQLNPNQSQLHGQIEMVGGGGGGEVRPQLSMPHMRSPHHHRTLDTL